MDQEKRDIQISSPQRLLFKLGKMYSKVYPIINQKKNYTVLSFHLYPDKRKKERGQEEGRKEKHKAG